MSYKRILTIQDISCVGQCSLTAALPILSACGFETCILPSALLSTHTGGQFKDFVFRDLTEEIPAILRHWEKEHIQFDALYTGYLGSSLQVDYALELRRFLKPGGLIAVDPAMADHGKLYSGFDMQFVRSMKKLCEAADILLPNITEACLLTDRPYLESYTSDDIERLCQSLAHSSTQTVILTGIGYTPETTGVIIRTKNDFSCYTHKKIDRICHGTGDIFASSFLGAYLNGKTARRAAEIAADYTLKCIENTLDDPAHWYGVKFEPLLGDLIREIHSSK